jgi:hypothetical protein
MSVESNTLFISWGRAVVGRETHAAELFAVAVAYYERWKKAGKIESWESVILSASGDDLEGFFIVRGTREQLRGMLDDTEFQENNMRASHRLTNFKLVHAYSGKACSDVLAMWGKALPR